MSASSAVAATIHAQTIATRIASRCTCFGPAASRSQSTTPLISALPPAHHHRNTQATPVASPEAAVVSGRRRRRPWPLSPSVDKASARGRHCASPASVAAAAVRSPPTVDTADERCLQHDATTVVRSLTPALAPDRGQPNHTYNLCALVSQDYTTCYC